MALQEPALAQADPKNAPAASLGISSPVAGVEPEVVKIPVSGAGSFGGDIAMAAQVFRPSGTGPFPVLLFSHGRAGDRMDRANLKRPVSSSQVRYWLGKGFAVVAPIRPGYGETGGADLENNSASFTGVGQCRVRPAYRRTAQAGSHAILAALEWVRAQPWANGEQVILEGQSMGGFSTVAAAATRPAGVIGYINFAGGAGGNPSISPGHNCDPELLTEIYGEFGKTTTLPNLWVYALNDQYFGPDAPAAWHASFAAGGSRTTFERAPAVPDGDGHGLSRHEPSYWASYLNRFLQSIDH
jgi:dienelactone hydrolase